MRILTVNAGSTSLKIELYELGATPPPIACPPDPVARFDTLEQTRCVHVDAVAHRIVRVPDGWRAVMRLDDAAIEQVRSVAGEAPLHDAPALQAVRDIEAMHPAALQYAVADGAFHRTLQPAAYTYAIPRELSRTGIRRRGFHGLSHEYAAHRAARDARRPVIGTSVVSLHLGGGSSLCAIRDGASIDTTMGYTPLEGIPMATRSGSIDPGVLLHLLRGGMSVDELERSLEHASGLLGISARSGDVRELMAAADDPDARLALDVLVWRTRAALGAMLAVLGSADLIVFTGGIGEHAAELRMRISAGVAIWAQTPVVVVPARENWMLARALAMSSA